MIQIHLKNRLTGQCPICYFSFPVLSLSFRKFVPRVGCISSKSFGFWKSFVLFLFTLCLVFSLSPECPQPPTFPSLRREREGKYGKGCEGSHPPNFYFPNKCRFKTNCLFGLARGIQMPGREKRAVIHVGKCRSCRWHKFENQSLPVILQFVIFVSRCLPRRREKRKVAGLIGHADRVSCFV